MPSPENALSPSPRGATLLSRRNVLALLSIPWVTPLRHASAAGATETSDMATARLVDAQLAPQQFALDLGRVPDATLTDYVASIAATLQRQVARTDLTLAVRVLRAHHLQAYAYPAGSIGLSRGMLLALQDESELAALIALQAAHAEQGRMSLPAGARDARQAVVTQAVAASQASAWSPPLGLDGRLGTTTLLPVRSADEARASDQRALQMLDAAGYPAHALPTLLQRLVDLRRQQPGLFAAFDLGEPALDSRVASTRQVAEQRHAMSRGRPVRRERWLGGTVGLQASLSLVSDAQTAEQAMLRQEWPFALERLQTALAQQPRDHGVLMRTAQCLQAMGRLRDARGHVAAAREVDPDEPLACKLGATLALAQRDPAHAWLELEAHDRLLPGDPAVVFLKGVALEALGQAAKAAEHYRAYLGYTTQGQAAQYASAHLRLLGR
ncbi:M48 family metalloprotease [Sphaerotilus mobilis]|uniref:Putative Zn-dependent protease n=1 Tax=Sphaerotilus mobilis TaxID=47994 RepID=A0A4Q7LHV5_9BURK|nr:M48 family metalloprotease [Sphaerotilus mobilis]RZS53028.1 putative Zn-dependent protease [Sphaerotilus mobilis]